MEWPKDMDDDARVDRATYSSAFDEAMVDTVMEDEDNAAIDIMLTEDTSGIAEHLTAIEGLSGLW